MVEKKSTLTPIAGTAAGKLFQRTESSKLIKSLTTSEERLSELTSGLEEGSKALEKLVKNLDTVRELEKRAIAMGLSEKAILATRSKREQQERLIEKHKETLIELEEDRINESIKVAGLRNRVNVINMPLSMYSSKMLKGTLKQEETKNKLLFKSLGKAWQSSSTMRSGLSDLLSPIAEPLGHIFSDFLPAINAAKTVMLSIAKIGKGSYEFLTGISRKNKKLDTNIKLLDAAQEISKSIGVNMQNVQIQLDNIIKEAKSKTKSDKEAREYVTKRVGELTNEYVAELSRKMDELPSEVQEQFSGFIDELQKLSKEAVKTNNRTLEEALEAKQQRIDLHRESQRMSDDAKNSVVNAVMDSARIIGETTIEAADMQIDEANQERLRGATTGKTGIFSKLFDGPLGFLSPMLGKFKGLLLGLPLLIWGAIKGIGGLIWKSIKGIGSLIGKAIKWALGPLLRLFGVKTATGGVGGLGGPVGGGIPDIPDTSRRPKGKPRGRLGKIKRVGGKLLRGAGKILGPVGIAVTAGIALADFADGFDEKKAESVFGSGGTLAKIGTGLSSVLSGLTFNLVPMETFANGFKSIINLGSSLGSTLLNLGKRAIPAITNALTNLGRILKPVLIGAKDWLVVKARAAAASGKQIITTRAKTIARGVGKITGSSKEFMGDMYNTLFEEAKKAGIKNPEVIARLGTAQSSLETGYGQHAPGQNYFGIKGKGGKQKTKEFINGKWVTINDSFQQYGSKQESAKGYIDFLLKNKRYKGVLAAENIDEAIMRMGQSGYATDPEYASKIANISGKIPVNRSEVSGKTPDTGDAARAIRVAENSVLTATQKQTAGIFKDMAIPKSTAVSQPAPVAIATAGGGGKGGGVPERWNLADNSVMHLVFQNTVS